MPALSRFLPVLFCLALAALALWASPLNAPENLGEYGLFELLQIIVLGLGCVLWLIFGPWHASLNCLAASLILVFIGREASWMEVYGGSEGMVQTLKITHGAFLAATLLGLAFFWLRPQIRRAQLFRTALRSEAMVWVGLGFVLLLVSDVFEKKFLPISGNLFWEECIELIAYFCALLPVILRFWGGARRQG